MEYDSVGNMISQADNQNGISKEMVYDSSNRINSVTSKETGDEIGRYWYDDQGFRVKKVSKRYINEILTEINVVYPSQYFGRETWIDHNGEQIEETRKAVNHIYLNGMRIAAMVPDGGIRYYLTDQVDSVKVVTDDEGLPVSRMEYLPYGEIWTHEGDKGNAPKYNSQELDLETNFYYYNARHYDPAISRFVSADTVIDGEFDTQAVSYTHLRAHET